MSKFLCLILKHSNRRINQVEGFRGYFKGLGPNLVGVIPARSINFFVYGNGKKFYTDKNGGKETAGVHLVSAATAGKRKMELNESHF